MQLLALTVPFISTTLKTRIYAMGIVLGIITMAIAVCMIIMDDGSTVSEWSRWPFTYIVLNILAIYSFQIPNELQIKMQNDIHNKFLSPTIQENLFPSSYWAILGPPPPRAPGFYERKCMLIDILFVYLLPLIHILSLYFHHHEEKNEWHFEHIHPQSSFLEKQIRLKFKCAFIQN